MMTREERAKQFQPFDAMKGLQEALRDREERYSRVEKHEISEEQIEKNSAVLSGLSRGMKVAVNYYCAFHDIQKTGQVTKLNIPFGYLVLDEEKILFSDIYSIKIVDMQ